MLYIQKKVPSRQTQSTISSTANTPEWRAIPPSDTNAIRDAFNSVPKASIQDDLLIEQHHLCGYCMCRIKPTADQFEGMRIDHVIPLSMDKHKALDYNNYLGVCFGGTSSSTQIPQRQERVLCCDAHKADQQLRALNPWDQTMMDHIAYRRDGYLYFNGKDYYSEQFCKNAEYDINKTLQLNGISEGAGRDGVCKMDTSTRIVEGRKNAFDSAHQRLAKIHPFTSSNIDREIQLLLNSPHREPFVGVVIFKLKQVRDRLRSEGR